MKERIKKLLNNCKKNILFYSVIYLIVFILLGIILSIFGIKYRQYINYFSIILILTGTIVGLIQIIIKTKSNMTKICIALYITSVIGLIGVFYPIIALTFYGLFPPEHIIEKDNKKYVAYEHSFLDTRVEYYDYINFLLAGNKIRIEEYYNDVGRDVLEEDAKGLFTPTYTLYYDNNGNYKYVSNEKNENVENKGNVYETVYTSEQLKKYESDFNTVAINGFVISTNTYTKPSEIDLEQVFYNGAGFNNEISKEELKEYKKITKYYERDIIKITSEQAKTVYYEKTGEKLENLQERLKNWIYIEKYDAYYNEISDTNFEKVSCLRGVMDEQNKIMKIQLSNDKTISIKIDYEKGKYYIISNNSTN